MRVVVFTGLPWSGKSEAVAVAKKIGMPVIRMGDMVWDETKKLGLKLTESNVGRIADNMRKKYGMDIWAKKTIDKIKKIKDMNILVIDGIRNIEEIKTFKKKLGEDFLVIGLQVSDKIRYQRAIKRNRKDDSKDLAKIKERDNREISWGLNKVIASANVIISNEESLKELNNKINEFFV